VAAAAQAAAPAIAGPPILLKPAAPHVEEQNGDAREGSCRGVEILEDAGQDRPQFEKRVSELQGLGR